MKMNAWSQTRMLTMGRFLVWLQCLSPSFNFFQLSLSSNENNVPLFHSLPPPLQPPVSVCYMPAWHTIVGIQTLSPSHSLSHTQIDTHTTTHLLPRGNRAVSTHQSAHPHTLMLRMWTVIHTVYGLINRVTSTQFELCSSTFHIPSKVFTVFTVYGNKCWCSYVGIYGSALSCSLLTQQACWMNSRGANTTPPVGAQTD